MTTTATPDPEQKTTKKTRSTAAQTTKKTVEKAVAEEPLAATTSNTNSNLPMISMILGLLSLTVVPAILGVPAVIIGIIGLKKDPANKGMSITGIVTGAIGILELIGVGIGLLVFVIAVVVAGSSSQTGPDQSQSPPNCNNSSGLYQSNDCYAVPQQGI